MAEVLQPRERPHLIQHLRRLSPFQIKLLSTAFAIGVVGFVIYAAAELGRPDLPKAKAPSVQAANSGFVDTDNSGRDSTTDSAPAETWTGWFGGKGAKLGFGFVGGFIIGFIFRTFVKMMTLITFVFVGILAALNYFHILNIDFTAVHRAYENNADWINDQAMRLKDLLVAHLPSTTTGAAGVWFGTRRR